MEVRNRFKGLDLIYRVPDELWTEVHDICTRDRDQDHAHGKEMQKKQNGCEEGLQIAVKRKEGKSKGEKERYKHLNAEFQE